MNIFCWMFGHSECGHYHKEDSVVICRGGCEKHELVFEIVEPCSRCKKTIISELKHSIENKKSMTISELIEGLKNFDGDRNVVVFDRDSKNNLLPRHGIDFGENKEENYIWID